MTYKEMTLAEITNGPFVLDWIMFAIFAAVTVFLLSGRGGAIVAGYKTLRKHEREKYDKKKLSRVVGLGMAVITLMILLQTLFMHIIPATFVFLFVALTIIDCIFIVVLCNKVCHRKEELEY